MTQARHRNNLLLVSFFIVIQIILVSFFFFFVNLFIVIIIFLIIIITLAINFVTNNREILLVFLFDLLGEFFFKRLNLYFFIFIFQLFHKQCYPLHCKEPCFFYESLQVCRNIARSILS